MYRDDIKKLDKTLEANLQTGYGMKDVGHMSDMAVLSEKLKEKCMGEACKFKNDLAQVVAMINPDMTPLQMEMVEDRLHAHQQKIEMISDAGQKAEAQKWYNKAHKAFEEIEHGKKTMKTMDAEKPAKAVI